MCLSWNPSLLTVLPKCAPQYKVLQEGGGMEHPTKETPCECHYAGRLLDGTEFDSSYARGTPSTFAPNQVSFATLTLPLTRVTSVGTSCWLGICAP